MNRLIPIVAFLFIFIAGPCLATTWDVNSDWSDVANPNGVWSYRQGSSALPHVAAWQQAGLGYSQPAWSVGESAPSEYLPAWFKTTGIAGLDWMLGDVVVHSTDGANGPSQGVASVRWVSPINGTINVVGAVWITRDIGRSVGWSLLKNGTSFTGGSVFSGDPYSRSSPMNFTAGTGGAGVLQSIPVLIGDTIDLQLATTSTFGDLVGVKLAIVSTVTAIGDTPGLTRFVLHDPLPNPFNPSISIAFDVPVGGADVSIVIYDVSGRRVRMLTGGHRSAGTQGVTWNGTDERGVRVASGVYLCRVAAGTFEATRKIVLVK